MKGSFASLSGSFSLTDLLYCAVIEIEGTSAPVRGYESGCVIRDNAVISQGKGS
jgi:hypothetical protein